MQSQVGACRFSATLAAAEAAATLPKCALPALGFQHRLRRMHGAVYTWCMQHSQMQFSSGSLKRVPARTACPNTRCGAKTALSDRLHHYGRRYKNRRGSMLTSSASPRYLATPTRRLLTSTEACAGRRFLPPCRRAVCGICSAAHNRSSSGNGHQMPGYRSPPEPTCLMGG